MSGPVAPRYALSPEWQHERRRLGLLEHAWDPLTTSQLAAIGVGPGLRCLEIGGGGGSIARWLCRQVGPSGRVTATDLDTRWLDEIDEPNLTVIRHDLLVDDFPTGSFDVIHARAVFMHIAARDSALAKVCEWLAPGGWLVLEDAAWFTAVSSGNAIWAAAMQAAWELLARLGADLAWARTFPAPLVRCGLQDVGLRVTVDVMQGGSALAEFWSLSLQAIGPRLIEEDLLSADALDQALAQLADSEFWDLSTASYCAWGHRAGDQIA
jgi:SAM-dependent methyltransferase